MVGPALHTYQMQKLAFSQPLRYQPALVNSVINLLYFTALLDYLVFYYYNIYLIL